MAACPLPNKEDDKQYAELLSHFASLGPMNDPAFKKALDILRNTSPTEAHKEMMACPAPSKGGKRKSRRGRKGRGGGEGEGDEGSEDGGDAASERSEPPADGNDSGRTKCYLRVMSKMAMLVGGLGYAGYRLLMPFIASSTGSPCSGWRDQAWGAFAGTVINPQMSCSYRQEAYDNIVSNLTTALVAGTGIPLGAVLWHSPELFGLVMKYLLAKECPNLYAPMSMDQLIGRWEQIKAKNPVAEDATKKKAKPAPKTTTTAKAAAEPATPAVEEAAEESGLDDPEEAVPTRRSTRSRRRGGKRRGTRRGHTTRRKMSHKGGRRSHRRTRRHHTKRRR